MDTCFVIQPFDSGKYDKRYKDVFFPAIKAAGLEPYRVDKDPSVSVPIEAIEENIRKAAICLADITEDNPNIWYELGFAFASSIPTVMVCSEERGKYPFDIQHRSIIKYLVQSGSDFDQLRQELTATLLAREKRDKALRYIKESNLVEPIQGLGLDEAKLLVVLARGCSVVDGSILLDKTERDAELIGIKDVDFKLAIKNLRHRGFITVVPGPIIAVKLNSRAWDWIEANKSQFV
jgi:hypothetical protein